MVRRKGRTRDKWRDKRWINVVAPESMNYIQLAHIPITTDEGAKGRVIEKTLYDILKGDPTQYSIKLYFQIDRIEGDTAHTIFKRYEYSKEYLKSLVRRDSSKINFIMDAETKDGYVFRINIIALTHKRLNSSRKHALRLAARNILSRDVPKLDIHQFVQKTCYGDIHASILSEGKKLVRLRHVGLEKVKLVRTAEKQITLLEA
ncbi:MAG: 30S ribosomal protein S3ae [Cenarchaeum sp. SB0665_bin_23]|nr:30S ribosomal protein S3ae [Cenarchaeum sp. SB0667_bin_13]MXY37411.1 30S ribosomal protein S3ae [Cenarchaeum sp. SB0664_bin_35]MXY61602.1 30S ribosomal protein S3ae [Cenarchaeum sp. SB0665_bin_23]MXZ93354.1 30S ribosomal protein S3ae [Cenarchaeum sp. SB0666_bin_15]MYB46502.1 30S ribosomal protein S3ae [Cenarchaeum sp. SB0662_bin_33]MYC80405.1 30S ribosomal protein S3ae [Cenarchaeum sp. SB0661_bin_35]MYD59044.1 30S ribosomal protein S3ae [Cenarchaeum sp. SB0678_bin_8]MYG33715.1 30S ribosom